jgi:hypothetical protein
MTNVVKDIIEQEVTVDDWVAYIRPYHHNLAVGRIVKFTPKMVRVLHNGKSKASNDIGDLVKITDVVKIDTEQIIVLRLAGKM